MSQGDGERPLKNSTLAGRGHARVLVPGPCGYELGSLALFDYGPNALCA